MIARDIMQKKLVMVPADMLVTELAELFVSKGISGAPVVDLGRPIGVVSMTDIVNARAEGRVVQHATRPHYYRDVWLEEEELDGFSIEEVDSRTVADIMTPAVYQAKETAPVRELIEMMLEAKIHRVIITRDDKAIGIVTTTDLIRQMSKLLPG